jgi:hypothetical protein
MRLRSTALPIALAALAACGALDGADRTCPDDGSHPLRIGEPGTTFSVQIADEPDEREAGLAGRAEIEAREGMVFLYDEPTLTAFTMRGMTFPLSIAFWGDDGRIDEIRSMQQCPAEPCPLTEPREAFVGALEVPQGAFERFGVEVGDPVTLEVDCA